MCFKSDRSKAVGKGLILTLMKKKKGQATVDKFLKSRGLEGQSFPLYNKSARSMAPGTGDSLFNYRGAV